jgi:precorrin-6B methylase 2
MLLDTDLADKIWDLSRKYTLLKPNTWDYIYNEVEYRYMARDEVRNSAYRKAIHQLVKDKTVIEIGPGSMLVLTLMCVEAGAKKIYAIEIDEDAYQQAQKLVQSKGLTDKIELFQGSSLNVDVPEKGDVCISDVIGCIGGIEGAAVLQHDAQRLLKPSGVMLPSRCLTWLSAVVQPEFYQDALVDQAFSMLTEEVYKVTGKSFPFPYYGITNFPASNLIAPPQVFEDLDFNNPHLTTDFARTLTFEVQREVSFDGLLLWIELFVDATTILNAWSRETGWETAYIPVEPVTLKPTDKIQIAAQSKLASHSFRPDYLFDISVWRQSQLVYRCLKDIAWS